MIVVIIDGKRHEVSGRVADMISWLIQAADRIRLGSVGVRFAYRGSTLKAVIEHEETINN